MATGRKIEFSTQKLTKVPGASSLGHGQWRVKGGDWIVYKEPYQDGTHGKRFARVIGVITATENDGLESGKGLLVVTAVSDDATFGYERWVDPKDVVEATSSAHVRKFMEWLLTATPAQLHDYNRRS